MKIVTFTDRCGGIGAVYNKGDVGMFPDNVADGIVAAKKGTAKPVPEPEETGQKEPETPQNEEKPAENEPETPENGKS
ncbi:hypothetical protein QQM41_03575 [Acetobacter sp. AC2005]|uniref:hypothetical protein n=1 Tax=unclassified Acetobacter TaxID=2628570 RepID=UPI0016AC6ABF|nr:hypothetical protein [Acetobacter sp.]